MHRQKNTVVKSAVPCGNPKRFDSRDVVRMPQDEPKRKKLRTSQEEDNTGDSEAHRHLQSLLQQQIKKDVTLTDQFSKHRTFTPATSHAPEVEKLAGIHVYTEYKHVDDLDSRIDYLRHCGLTDEEITLKLKEDLKDQVKFTTSGYGADPQSLRQKLKEIERKIQDKEKNLQVPDSFKGALELSRQAMDLEKSQAQRQGRELPGPSIITKKKKFEVMHPDDPINHIPQILQGMDRKKDRAPRRERRRRRKLEQKQKYYAAFATADKVDSDESDSEHISDNDGKMDEYDQLSPSIEVDSSMAAVSSPGDKSLQKAKLDLSRTEFLELDSHQQCNIYDTSLKHLKSTTNSLTIDSKSQNSCDHTDVVDASKNSGGRSNPHEANHPTNTVKELSTAVQLLSKEEILSNRMSIEEIKTMDKFQNYTEGIPNKVVYVKNLPNKTTEEDLVALFGLFQSTGNPKIVFKLLSGRMKGQAFVTFPDEETATEAIKLVNGYKLQGKPVILSFGRKQ